MWLQWTATLSYWEIYLIPWLSARKNYTCHNLSWKYNTNRNNMWENFFIKFIKFGMALKKKATRIKPKKTRNNSRYQTTHLLNTWTFIAQCFFTNHLNHKTVNKATCRTLSANPCKLLGHLSKSFRTIRIFRIPSFLCYFC